MKTCLVFILSFILTFCSKDKVAAVNDEEGRGDITLTAGGEKYNVKGACGWASVGGAKYIGCRDDDNSLKTLSIFFNVDELPGSTTSYTLVGDVLDEDPKHVTMNITELKSGSLFEYTSTLSSGKITVEVSGKKVKLDLEGVKLKPTTSSPMYTSLNTGAFSKEGVLSGTIEFTK
jgi:hypothetical protein